MQSEVEEDYRRREIPPEIERIAREELEQLKITEAFHVSGIEIHRRALIKVRSKIDRIHTYLKQAD